MSYFAELAPERMTPKVHMLLHYPCLMLLYGPVRQLWCMRFEGKHAYFKRIAQTMCNFKNPCFSLSLKHQMFACWHLRSGGYIAESSISHSAIRQVQFGQLPATFQTKLNEFIMSSVGVRLTAEDIVHKVIKLTVGSVQYSVGDFFVIDVSEGEEVPIFIKVLHVCGCRSLWYVCGHVYTCTQYVHHRHAYLINNLNEWRIMVPGQERDYHALDAYADNEDNLFVTLQHEITTAS